MLPPDYQGNSIVNMMSSILAQFGGKPQYLPLVIWPEKEFQNTSTIVLILIDGMGYNFLTKYGKNTRLFGALKGKMTSVFPTTTAAAMTSLYTGAGPQNHGVLAWFTYLKELGTVATILPLIIRGYKYSMITKSITPEAIFQYSSIFSKLKAKCYTIVPKGIINSSYNQVFSASANQIGYSDLVQYFKYTLNIIKTVPGKKFILAYWPELDKMAHDKGINSFDVQKHLQAIDDEFGRFLEGFMKEQSHNPEVQQTKIIVTADHGLIDTDFTHTLLLDQYPALQQCLTVPMCGEPRAVFCYIRPSKVRMFEDYVQSKMSDVCVLTKSEDLFKQNYFGRFDPHPRFFDRMGDYILLMKENYILKDQLLGETRRDLIGDHGGLSEDELFVPFILI